jgi:ATP phosphoribosyltransferase regulatory subunit HisZ
MGNFRGIHAKHPDALSKITDFANLDRISIQPTPDILFPIRRAALSRQDINPIQPAVAAKKQKHETCLACYRVDRQGKKWKLS